MPTLAELKASSPAYAEMSDQEFAQRVYDKHYRGKMAYADFAEKTGAPPADFSGVRSSVAKDPDPLEGMGRGERLAAGFGGSFVDLYRGGKQMLTERVAEPLNAAGNMLGLLGLTNGARQPADVVNDSLARQQEEIDQAAEIDAPLKSDPYGLTGNVAGALTQIMLPGAALKGTRGQGAFLPKTIRGNAIQGAAFGGLQPVETGGSRAENVATGAALGGVGAAIPRAIGGTIRAVRGSPLTAGGAQRRAIETVVQEAENPASLLNFTPSAVPGVQRSLAESTLDGGVARLERLARDRGRGWSALDSRNNYARAEAIGRFAGDESTLDAAKAARSQQSGGFLDTALQARGVDTAPVMQAMDDAVSRNAGRSSVQRAIEDVRSEMANVGDDVAGLYNVRKSIDDLMNGRAGTEKSYAQAAKRELVQIKEVLDAQIKAASPEFGQYLDSYIAGSRPINRMQLGQSLLDSGTGKTRDATTGAYQILPGAFGGQVKGLDRLAARATGFKGARAASLLEPEDMATIGAIEDDLNRQVFARTANVGKNSHTNQLGQMGQKVSRQAMARMIPFYGAAVEHLERVGSQRVIDALDEVLQDPSKYRQVASALSAGDRRLLEQSLTRIGGTSGVVVPALTE